MGAGEGGDCHTVSLDPDGKTLVSTLWKHRGPLLALALLDVKAEGKTLRWRTKTQSTPSWRKTKLWAQATWEAGGLVPSGQGAPPRGHHGSLHEKSLLPCLGRNCKVF